MKCPQCGEVLHSTFRHDYQQCGCDHHTMVDGGDDYMRVGGVVVGDIIIVGHVHLPNRQGVMLLDD